MTSEAKAVSGEFVTLGGVRSYAIRNVDRMPPFFVSVVSHDDHWLFVSSNGGLTAGRVSPETALFPYVTVDKIHDSYLHTGPRTVMRVGVGEAVQTWEPFNRELDGQYDTDRHLYKSMLGNRIRFEEINHDLELTFRYTWLFSSEFGFVRLAEIENHGHGNATIEMLDGMQDLLPAGTPRFTQTNSSNLVDAYKWTELDESSGLGFFTLYSGISDKAEPCESLRANTVFSLGLDSPTILLSSKQLQGFRTGGSVEPEHQTRGIRGSYFVHSTLTLDAGARKHWMLVANVEQSQTDVVALKKSLDTDRDELEARILESVAQGDDALARIMAAADGFQMTAEENVTGHHYANVLFNVLRGGIFNDQYTISASDFRRTVRHFNKRVFERNRTMLDELPNSLSVSELQAAVDATGDAQLLRLTKEYLPITFGRRHGDPSRPWNQFAIRLKDDRGRALLSYEGNWRDIFQNWEALAYSYPGFLSGMIAKFVNASTADGYNPYRITKEGIDWEVEEPDNPWSYIGYWGDHQIIYLLKLLELSVACAPEELATELHEKHFAYANVPYRLCSYEDLLRDPKDTVSFDDPVAERIEQLLETLGADGKLLLDANGDVVQVTLLEKLLVPLLSKLGNLVVEGGIWMNTQRPEWNDANNALVGHGLSMVTLYYMRRYVAFLASMLGNVSDSVELSTEVGTWLTETGAALADIAARVSDGDISAHDRRRFLDLVGTAADRYRRAVYRQDGFSGVSTVSKDAIVALLESSLAVIDHSIACNRRDDGLYEAYNLIHTQGDGVTVDTLYPMLEGQVAALSSGAVAPSDACDILETMFTSVVYRDDQKSFMLYPDRDLPDYLERNRIPDERAAEIEFFKQLEADGDVRLIERDASGHLRFHSDFVNAGDVRACLKELRADYPEAVDASAAAIESLYEDTFNHRAFTGRSGTMFGFEGLGSIYWHMVSKLLLATMEVFYHAVDDGADAETLKRLGGLYYRIREGIGFNKTPAEYGAFPLDPYSHTPRHAGAQQPGMTGQVKEEIVARFAELGIRIAGGETRFEPALLRRREFRDAPAPLWYVDVADNWHELSIPPGGLGFTWCQVPILYLIGDTPGIELRRADDSVEQLPTLKLDAETTRHILNRTGDVAQIIVTIPAEACLGD